MFPPNSLHSTEILFCVSARVILVIFFFNVKIWSVVDPPWYLPIGISKKSISKYMNSNFIFFSAESPNAKLANSSRKITKTCRTQYSCFYYQRLRMSTRVNSSSCQTPSISSPTCTKCRHLARTSPHSL
jgi:hypothetical protein